MSGQLKSGDIALIIGGDDQHEIGMQVELIALYEHGQEYRLPESPILITNDAGCSVWLVKGDVSGTLSCGTVITGYTQKAPYNLMPLRGDFTPEEMREIEKETS